MLLPNDASPSLCPLEEVTRHASQNIPPTNSRKQTAPSPSQSHIELRFPVAP